MNASLETVLGHCGADAQVAVIGPTAGCVPDPLFRRGVDRVGASSVVDLELLLARARADEPWGDSVRKYVIGARDYPGYEALLHACA